MNCYTYEELNIGDKEHFSVEITKKMMDLFLELSGDVNPMHTDLQYALSKGFQSELVYGMLTSSFYSTLVGTYIPGKYCIFQEAALKFRKPVYVGDILTITGELIEKNDTYKRLLIKVIIKNQDETIVSSATLTVGCVR